MVEKKSIPCTFLFSGYRLVNIQGGIFVWKKERKIKYGRRKNRKTENKGDHGQAGGRVKRTF